MLIVFLVIRKTCISDFTHNQKLLQYLNMSPICFSFNWLAQDLLNISFVPDTLPKAGGTAVNILDSLDLRVYRRRKEATN